MNKKKRKINTKYIGIVDKLIEASKVSDVTKVVLAELIGIEYITLDKYLRKERFVSDELVAKRMVVTTNLLNELVAKGELPVAAEVSKKLKSGVIMEVIDTYLSKNN